ncbi:uncharacterized protein LOC144004815 [Festucalex cinctus]
MGTGGLLFLLLLLFLSVQHVVPRQGGRRKSEREQKLLLTASERERERREEAPPPSRLLPGPWERLTGKRGRTTSLSGLETQAGHVQAGMREHGKKEHQRKEGLIVTRRALAHPPAASRGRLKDSSGLRRAHEDMDGCTCGETDGWTDDTISSRLLRCASAYGDLQPRQTRTAPATSRYVPPLDYSTAHGDDDDLIKPRKLLNPVKSSRSHQELHRELMSSCKRSGGGSVETNKPELERVLERRRRDQLIRQRKREKEACRKISPLEAELRKRHQALEEMEQEQQKDECDTLVPPEFVKVKENLRKTSCAGKEEKQV